jgi:excisionase family DNA binding protein
MDDEHSTAGLLGLGEAADLAECSRDTIRRAAQKGELKAEMGPGVRGPQWWIQEADLLAWLDHRATSEVSTAARQQPPQQHRSTAAPESRAQHSTAAGFQAPQHPPVELYLALVDRLQHAERRAVELELALRQSQRLLTENAESITEREARARQAEAVAEEARRVEADLQAENTRLAAELAAVRRPERRQGFLGWLGFRRASTSATDATKTA